MVIRLHTHFYDIVDYLVYIPTYTSKYIKENWEKISIILICY